MREKRIDNVSATGAEKKRFGLSRENNGNGKSKSKSAIVEKVEPVGVKFATFAKSNGRKSPKNERRVISATRTALP